MSEHICICVYALPVVVCMYVLYVQYVCVGVCVCMCLYVLCVYKSVCARV